MPQAQGVIPDKVRDPKAGTRLLDPHSECQLGVEGDRPGLVAVQVGQAQARLREPADLDPIRPWQEEERLSRRRHDPAVPVVEPAVQVGCPFPGTPSFGDEVSRDEP
jgi:hypothetical protein